MTHTTRSVDEAQRLMNHPAHDNDGTIAAFADAPVARPTMRLSVALFIVFAVIGMLTAFWLAVAGLLWLWGLA